MFEVYSRGSGRNTIFLGLGIVGMEELPLGHSQRQVISLQSRPYENDPVSGTLTVEVTYRAGPKSIISSIYLSIWFFFGALRESSFIIELIIYYVKVVHNWFNYGWDYFGFFEHFCNRVLVETFGRILQRFFRMDRMTILKRFSRNLRDSLRLSQDYLILGKLCFFLELFGIFRGWKPLGATSWILRMFRSRFPIIGRFSSFSSNQQRRPTI